MTSPPKAPAILTIENLSITLPNGRVLLESANLSVAQGEFVLLVGPSGSGKSTLLKLIGGIEESGSERLGVSGAVCVHVDSGHDARGEVGIVFQNLALFDELSAVENVQFALDHAKTETNQESAESWLRRLGVPTDVPLSRLSGGERQRVALARTLARDPKLILFDEPTTGLDPMRARSVVDLLLHTHRESRKTMVVVTHDYAPFLAHKPRLILVDAERLQLREVEADELVGYFSKDSTKARSRTGDERVRSLLASKLLSWIDAPGALALAIVTGLAAPFQGWSRSCWKLRYLRHYTKMVLWGTTFAYVALAGIMLGFVSVTFTFKHLPYGQVTRPLLTEEFLAATGYSSFRVIVPLLVGLLMAGKCAAAVSADVGARRLTSQFEALRSMFVRPNDYLLGNIVLALTLAGPLLTMVAFLASTGAAMVAFLLSVDEGTAAIFRRNYFATVWPISYALPKGTLWVMGKSAVTGFSVATLSYLIGSRPKDSSVDVSRDVGRTIFWASLAVLLLHSIFSFIEF